MGGGSMVFKGKNKTLTFGTVNKKVLTRPALQNILALNEILARGAHAEIEAGRLLTLIT